VAGGVSASVELTAGDVALDDEPPSEPVEDARGASTRIDRLPFVPDDAPGPDDRTTVTGPLDHENATRGSTMRDDPGPGATSPVGTGE